MNSRRAFLLGGLFCAMSKAPAHAAATRALDVLGNPYNAETYRRLMASWGKPAGLSFSARESDEIVRALLLRALTGARLPDVAFFNADVIRLFAERGLLVPLDRSVGTDARTIRVRDVAYGVPIGVSAPIVAFNAALLRRLGVHDVPRDWPGILTLASRMRSSDVVGGFIEHDNGGAFTFQYLLGSFGGRMMSEDERAIAFNCGAGLQSLEVLRGFGTCGQAQADMSRRQARRAFASGRIGVLVTMSSVLPNLRKTLAVVHVPMPLMVPHAQVPVAGPIAVMLDKERSEAAADFMRFATSPAGQAIVQQTSGYLPLSAAPERATAWYSFPGRNSLKIAELIQDEMQQVATLQKTPERALSSMATAVAALLA